MVVVWLVGGQRIEVPDAVEVRLARCKRRLPHLPTEPAVCCLDRTGAVVAQFPVDRVVGWVTRPVGGT